MPEPQDLGRRTRQLRNLVEPVAAAVFFVPEAQEAYVRLGFPPPRGTEDGIPLFDWGAYFVSRAACLRQVHGAVVAAAFGVFEPTWVEREIGWSRQEVVTAAGLPAPNSVPPGAPRGKRWKRSRTSSSVPSWRLLARRLTSWWPC